METKNLACQEEKRFVVTFREPLLVLLRKHTPTLLLTLIWVVSASAQWTGHELPVAAAGAVSGALEITDWDHDGDLDLAALYTDSNFLTNLLPDDGELYTDEGLSDSVAVFFADTADVDNDGDMDYLFSGASYPYPINLSCVGWIELLVVLLFPHIGSR